MTFWSTSIVSVLLLGLVVRWRLQQGVQYQQLRLGLAQLSRLQQLIMLCQQHRGTSNAVVNGDQSLRPQLLNLQQQIDSFIKDRQSRALERFPQWQSFVDHWPRLKQNVLLSNQKAFLLVRQHNLMIEGQLSLTDDVCRYYRLHHLMLDNMTRVSEVCLDTLRVAETIGQMRAIGSGICSRGRVDGADAITLEFLHRSVQGRTEELLRELQAIKNPQLRKILNSQLPLINEHTSQLFQLVEQEVLGRKITLVDAKKYLSVATRPIRAVLESFNIITQYAVINYAKLI
ncbi:MAG TPA: nitrate- and nitrite sensing domain-containing protein [Methylotenera sp.]|nr:nitrate- and nitrite sensing domain-containing protein [Methylotenera sp.]